MSNEINALRKKVGQRWFKLAVKWSTDLPSSRLKRQEIIRSMHPDRGGSAKRIGGLKDSLEAVELIASRIRDARYMTNRHRYRPYVPEKTTPEQRLRDRIKVIVKQAVWRNTNSPAHGDLVVMISDKPEELGMEVEVSTIFPYKGNYKTYRANEYHRVVTVPRRYLSRVYRTGLTDIGGMVTLDAAPVDSPDPGVRVFAATWLVHGKSYQCRPVHGFIAISESGENFHGKTVASAVRGVHERMLPQEDKTKRSRERFKKRLDNIVERSNGTLYSMQDAEALGFCDYGIRSWCNRVGLDPASKATMKEIVDGYWKAPVEEARRFILHYSKK